MGADNSGVTTCASIGMDEPHALRRAPRRRPRVLMLAHRAPYPPDRGDRIRSYHLLRALAVEADVSLACTADEPVAPEHREVLASLTQRLAVRRVTPRGVRARAAAALLSGRAGTPAGFFRADVARRVCAWDEEAPFDAVLTFCTGMIGYTQALQRRRRALGRPAARHVLDLVDVDSAKWEAYAAASAPPLRWAYAAEARRLARVEAGDVAAFDAVCVVSRREAELYHQRIGHRQPLHVISNGVDTDYFRALPDNDSATLCFVGVLDYRPNVEGVAWFVREVMPALRRRVPEARLLIAGRDPTPAVTALGRHPGAGVEVLGPVPDVREVLARSAAVVAPLRIARGVQNKVLEAMASARAVVSSPAAAEGIDAAPGSDLLVADEPAEWVDRLAAVLRDPTLRRRVAAAGRERVVSAYDWGTCLRPMMELVRPVDLLELRGRKVARSA